IKYPPTPGCKRVIALDVYRAWKVHFCKFEFVPGINYFNSIFVSLSKFSFSQLGMLRYFSKQWTVNLVKMLHHSKVFRRLRLSFQQVVHKALLIIFVLECPVAYHLITHGRTWDSAQRLAAGRTGSVARPYLHIIRKFRKSLNRFIHLLCSFFLSTGKAC